MLVFQKCQFKKKKKEKIKCLCVYLCDYLCVQIINNETGELIMLFISLIANPFIWKGNILYLLST